MTELLKIDYNFIPFLLWCSEKENVNRMHADNRSLERIQITLDVSRKSFNDVTYPKIDITYFSVVEAAKNIILQAEI